MKRPKITKTYTLFETILRSNKHPLSLEEIHKKMQKHIPSVAFSTVYRLAKSFEDQQKILRVDWRDRGSRFEWADREHHHHIVCTVCGKSTDVQAKNFTIDEKAITKETGYQITNHNIEIEGICNNCQHKS